MHWRHSLWAGRVGDGYGEQRDERWDMEDDEGRR